eukprot:GHVT01045246.1.p2 GENE.GHVT01045246.1~~GHVT01045246.1.p2  ORF type:complete len:125 (-),score=20.40 GHVT01045246.1:964-1338(-)
MSPAGAASAAFLGGVGDDWASRFSACCPAEYCTNPLGTDLIALLSEQGRNLLDAKETEFVLPPRRFILQVRKDKSRASPARHYHVRWSENSPAVRDLIHLILDLFLGLLQTTNNYARVHWALWL